MSSGDNAELRIEQLQAQLRESQQSNSSLKEEFDQIKTQLSGKSALLPARLFCVVCFVC